ncbi:MAG: response regulator transcription factor [Lachnospiraceae bacterium]|nr:response regulator transcription factor [Lachnospiraceae bacterium]
MRILLAEDERSMSRALVAILTKNNYSVDAVYDGQDAADYLITGNYDAAILDVMMLTAKSEVDDKVEGLDLGANDYLTKPFDGRELLARLRAMTRTGSSSEGNILRFGNVSLDRAGFELSSASGSVRLSSKEFQIMEYLMSNPGMLITTERLFNKIWGLDFEGDPGIVWTNLSYLRKKLVGIGSNVRIKAVRNAGYRLVTEEESDK